MPIAPHSVILSNLAPLNSSLRILRAIANVTLFPAPHSATNSVTSTRFTVPAAVPAATVTWPATTLPALPPAPPTGTKSRDGEVTAAPGNETAKAEAFQVAKRSRHAAAPAAAHPTPRMVMRMVATGAACTVSSKIAEERAEGPAFAGTRNFRRATLVEVWSAVVEVETTREVAVPKEVAAFLPAVIVASSSGAATSWRVGLTGAVTVSTLRVGGLRATGRRRKGRFAKTIQRVSPPLHKILKILRDH